MFKRMAVVGLSCLLAVGASAEKLPTVALSDQQPQSQAEPRAKEVLTDVAIAVLIVAGSVAAYKAMGRPCACPSDTMRNGRKCGDNSAWSRAGGFKPLCFPTEVSTAMIEAYRATKAIPGLR